MGRAAEELSRGRRLYAEQSWGAAQAALSAADRELELAGADIELLSTVAYMLGDADQALALLERAHATHRGADELEAALRCAIWIGLHSAQRGEIARAGGWLARAERLLEQLGGERAERGYLLLPGVFELEARGELEAAAATAGEAAAIAQRFGDRDLFGLAAHTQGHILIEAGRTSEGLGLLDETMLAAATGELSPIVTGIVYCGVILACQAALEVRRAREWTTVLSEWCERQPDLVAFSGRCLIHRAEIMELEGDWERALAEARRAELRSARGANTEAVAEARYRQGELHRLRGERAEAERAYRAASQAGREPQPGLSLLRLAEGKPEAALAAITRALEEASDPAERLRLLPAAIEITLTADGVASARALVDDLRRLADVEACPALAAPLARAEAAVALADGQPRAALPALRRATEIWQELAAPYEAARTRELTALAREALGDAEGATLQREAAHEAYEGLGAAPDLARVDQALDRGAGASLGLTDRELEVLRLVATGRTNRAVAAELVLSERTVDRHVSNIFVKLDVSSRAAATAYAYEHHLL